MQIATAVRDHATIVAPSGVIDVRGAQEFEAALVTVVTGGTRSIAIDFGAVTLITSAGIRVLVMMAQRLKRAGGGLVLFALGGRVQTVFEIGGLLHQFQIVATEPEALALLAGLPSPPPAAAPVASRLAEAVADVVVPTTGAWARQLGQASRSTSALAVAVWDVVRFDSPTGRPAT